MELISRAFLSKLINTQFQETQELNKDTIYRRFNLKPYKREGKTWLYKVKEVNEAGISYSRNLPGYTPIPHFEEKYWINKQAQIINVYTENQVATHCGIDLYEHVTLVYYGKKYRKRVHSLMGKTFLGGPPVVNHKNGKKSDNSLKNLERSTNSRNVQHAYDEGYYTSRGGQGTPIVVSNKRTGESFEFSSLRKAEDYTKVARHRIKTIIAKKIPNNTEWDFIYK